MRPPNHHRPDSALGGAEGVWITAPDGPAVVPLIVLLGAFIVIDRGTWLLARGTGDDIDSVVLVMAAVIRNPAIAAAAAGSALLLLLAGRARVFASWAEFERGASLRWFAAVVLAVLVWRFALYDYNWFAGRWHSIDRVLVLGFAVGALFRPVLLLPFVATLRIVADQFSTPLPASSATTLREFVVLVAVALAALVIVHLVTGERRTDAVPLVIAGLVAAQFWASGFQKLRIGWVLDNDLSELPLNAYAQGWLGHTGGDFAESLSSLLASLRWPIVAAVLVFELGVALALAHRHLFRLWLVAAPLFHLINFLILGFVFLDWVIVEVAFLILVSRSNPDWLARAWAWPRSLAVVGLVLLTSVTGLVFHPPALAWFDVPVVYAYEIEAVTADGDILAVEPDAFSPYVQPMAYGALALGPRIPLTQGYGVTNHAGQEALDGVDTMAQLAALESKDAPDPRRVVTSTAFLQRFIDASQEGFGFPMPSPPDEFQISHGGPTYKGEPIAELHVTQITKLRSGSTTEVRQELALILRASR